MSIMRPDPLPGENAALWSFSQVGDGGGGWLVQGPVVNQSSLGLLVQVFTTFPAQA